MLYTNPILYARVSPDGLKFKELVAELNGVPTSIPQDPANSDYAELMRQVEEEGLVIKEEDHD